MRHCTCKHCNKLYIPRRYGAQKYCSNSCRSRAFQLRKAHKISVSKKEEASKSDEKKFQQPKINMADISNAALGAAAYDLGKRVFTPSDKQPATRKDIDDLYHKLEERYHPVHNAPKRNDGTYAFYDKQTKEVIYLKVKQNGVQ